MVEEVKDLSRTCVGQVGSRLSGISVIIPTLNRAEVLLNSIGDILVQEFHDWELIVIDQSDIPNARVIAMLKDSPYPTKYYKAAFRGLPQARNFGWRAAQKDIVLYIDDDIRCEPGFLQAHYDAHLTSGAALIAGGIEELKGDVTTVGATGSFNWWTATGVRNFHLREPGRCLHAPGGNFSIRRNVLHRIGGFDEALTVGAALYEESEMALRLHSAGYQAWFEPSAHLVHLAAPLGGCRVRNDWKRYMFGMAHNRSVLIFRHLWPWHRPSALARLLLFGLSYSRLDRSFRPFWATLKGIKAGRQTARGEPLNAKLTAEELLDRDANVTRAASTR